MNRPDSRKKSGIRNGFAKATTGCRKPSPPMASPVPMTECIMTTSRMQMPFATSTQASRPAVPPACPIDPAPATGPSCIDKVDGFPPRGRRPLDVPNTR